MISRFILLFFCVALQSCRCVQTALAPEEQAWLAPYRTGEHLLFRSNYGALDTLIVVNKQEYYTNSDCNWFEVSSFQKHTISLKLIPIRCRPHTTCTLVASIRKDNPEKHSLPFFDFLGLEYLPLQSINSPIISHSITLSTTGKTYSMAYLFAAGANTTSIGTGYLHSFDWDKVDGLVRYQTHNGEIFELLTKTP